MSDRWGDDDPSWSKASPDNPIICERIIEGKRYHQYWCPGCDSMHQITINPDKNGAGAGWTFTGTLEKPTYMPSQLTSWGGRDGQSKRVCHTFIKEGQLQYLGDCTHEMAGKTIDMVPIPDWLNDECKAARLKAEGA